MAWRQYSAVSGAVRATGRLFQYFWLVCPVSHTYGREERCIQGVGGED